MEATEVSAQAISSTAPSASGSRTAKIIVSFVTAAGQIVTSAQSVAYGSPYSAGRRGQQCWNYLLKILRPEPSNFVCPTGTVANVDGAESTQRLSGLQCAHLNDRGFN